MVFVQRQQAGEHHDDDPETNEFLNVRLFGLGSRN